MEDELDMEVELERELAAEQEELLEEEEDELDLQHALEMARDLEKQPEVKKPLSKVLSLPANFTFSSPRGSLDAQEGSCNCEVSRREGYCLPERDAVEKQLEREWENMVSDIQKGGDRLSNSEAGRCGVK
jgi:hypothetical protein